MIGRARKLQIWFTKEWIFYFFRILKKSQKWWKEPWYWWPSSWLVFKSRICHLLAMWICVNARSLNISKHWFPIYKTGIIILIVTSREYCIDEIRQYIERAEHGFCHGIGAQKLLHYHRMIIGFQKLQKLKWECHRGWYPYNWDQFVGSLDNGLPCCLLTLYGQSISNKIPIWAEVIKNGFMLEVVFCVSTMHRL